MTWDAIILFKEDQRYPDIYGIDVYDRYDDYVDVYSPNG